MSLSQFNLFPLFVFQTSWNRVFTILIHPPTPSSLEISRSSFSFYNICSDLVDESMQVDTSLANFSLPPTSDPPSTEPIVDSSSSLGSHLMIEPKLVVSRLVIQQIFDVLSSSRLLYALFASIEDSNSPLGIIPTIVFLTFFFNITKLKASFPLSKWKWKCHK